ncbi:hypothetical protein ACFX14_045400 [Malus domestica]
MIRAGTAPVITVPNPLYKPGIPSAFQMPLATDNASLSRASLEATCRRVFTTETGYSATVTPVNKPAPTT